MKTRNTLVALALAAFIGTAFKSTIHNEGKYIINTELSSVEWVGKKVAGEHKGKIGISKGAILSHDGTLTNGSITMDMNSITCTDMEGEYGTKLVGHLKNDDFFACDKFPVSSFEITKLTPSRENTVDGSPNYTVSGKITIKGITQEINFPAYILIKDNNLAASGELVIDRTKFDIKYGSSNFFEGLGDKAIYNEFNLKFKLAAQKS